VHDALVQGARDVGAEDRGVVEAYRAHGEPHDRPRGQLVLPGSVGGLDLLLRGGRPVGLPHGQGLGSAGSAPGLA
jgi:hypothetical protein